MNDVFNTHIHECELCVVGGGLAGMCAAIAAARHGISVVIMQDRPMFGGNASSEIRMWVSGATGDNNRETGIMEELALENLYRNPERGFPIWDSVTYEAVMNEKNVTPILNCSCLDAKTEGGKIISVTGWQTTTQQFHTVKAKYFADCSGDSILAPLSGAEFRIGREARDEFCERIAPIVSDKKTMGLTCLIQARELERPVKFIAPTWANKYTREDLAPYRIPDMSDPAENYWYMELGGEYDSIGDTEILRDMLLKVAFGIWDYIKNSGDYEADLWSLDFVGFLPGKRESRRYVGDYIMTQNDVRAEGKFRDTVAFGGWPMDDHNPAGIATKDSPNIFHPAPSPFGIPYRCLYSKNVENLFFAGRNISLTHAAMSSTRVMATCALLGQAVGSAAAVAAAHSTSPRGVYENHLTELQEMLLEDDCYLPGFPAPVSDIMKSAEIRTTGKYPERLINGINRKRGDDENAWEGKCGDEILIDFKKAVELREMRITLDSDLNRLTVGAGGYVKNKPTVSNTSRTMPFVHLPETLVKDMDVTLSLDGGEERTVFLRGIKRRLVTVAINERVKAIKLVPVSTYGAELVRIFSLNVK